MKAGGYIALLLWAVSLYAPPLFAEVYKYQDAQGNWQFSDRPPPGAQQSERLDIGRSSTTELPQDLHTHLLEKYAPDGVVEAATLAVVSIATKLGSGSGFFVSDDGYIVTNKHVVRPTESSSWEEQADSLENAKRWVKETQARLAARKARLNKMYDELSDYKRDIDRYEGRDKAVALSEYRIYKKRYDEMKRDYERASREFDRKKRDISSSDTEFTLNSSLAKTASRFEITLKSGASASVRLVEVSTKHDLALLKLDGHVTPALDIGRRGVARQGTAVYAIGSPLGMKDFVTAGIITGVRGDGIVTDTQILPGNSGGPLIDEQGRVLGVNTQKLHATRSVGSEGFGIAIPMRHVLAEFGALINN